MPALAPFPSQSAPHFLAKLANARVDAAAGVIFAATVAKAGVPALGKFLWLDKAGQRTYDEKLAVKKIPVFTDEKTLDTLMASAQDAGARVKCREDHDDTLKARIGYCFNFKRTAPDIVSTDIKVFDKFTGRDLLFETALQTPELIGLSIDPGELQFDIGMLNGQTVAFMRVTNLEAVDVVDAGAITPEGLLMKAAGVDTPDDVTKEKLSREQSQPTDHMAAPTPEEIMAAVKQMTDGYAAFAKQVTDQVAECMASVKKLAIPPAPAADAQTAAALKDISDRLAAQTTALAQMKKEKALLGFRGSQTERELLAATQTAEDIDKLNATKKDYITMLRATAAADKCSTGVAHEKLVKTPEGKAAHREYLLSKGMIKGDQMAA